MGLVALKTFYGFVGVIGDQALVGEAEDVIGGYFKYIGQPDEQSGIRDGDSAFNAA